MTILNGEIVKNSLLFESEDGDEYGAGDGIIPF